ncbi:hypothetical protein AVEN_124217-1 [Araneus ventricosus]|uniref:Transposase Tc1-like domain-containing protein n=1 Tax=Araneus ventricosus TaxID=182803 RepID=A0A4Y2N1K5_ARAVE|nr:hypothetical protein AVEN_124217-1 [Araneus ventricosus]
MELCFRRPARVLQLTKRHRQLRLQWTREHRDWTMDEWKGVAWWDESRFLIHDLDGRVRVRRLPGEQLFPSCTAGHTQARCGGIMLWGRSHGLILIAITKSYKTVSNEALQILSGCTPLDLKIVTEIETTRE